MIESPKTTNDMILSDNLSEDSSLNYNIPDFQSDKHVLNNIQKMKEFIYKKYNKFLENYELTNCISYGGRSIVYEGFLKSAGNIQNLAFKFKISDKNKLDGDSQGISILKKLHHKYIIQIYAFVKMDDYSNFSILELAKHGNIEYFQKEFLKRNVLSEIIICYFT